MKEPTAIAIAGDSNSVPGYVVALHSFLKHCTPTHRTVRISFLHDGVPPALLDQLSKVANQYGQEIEYKELSQETFPVDGLPLLAGSALTYARLFLPQIVNADRLIYFDADMLFCASPTALFEQDFQDHPLLAAVTQDVKSSNDHPLLYEIGMEPETPYFNAGILVFNVPQWRELDLTNSCAAFAKRHRSKLACVDQTVLNATLHGSVADLGRSYNTACYPHTRRIKGPLPTVLHFLGRPKPWDPFAPVTNLNHPLFRAAEKEAGFNSQLWWLKQPLKAIRRIVTSHRSYAATLIRRNKHTARIP